MDYNMQSMDDLVKRDKKLGRVRQGGNGQRGGSGAPLPGRGRGGANNANKARAQQKVRPYDKTIQKRQNAPERQQMPQQRQRQQMSANQNQDSNRNQLRNQRRRERLMGDENMQQPAKNAGNQAVNQRRQQLQNLRQNRKLRGRRVPIANQNQPRNGSQPPLRKRMPQAPVQAQNRQPMNQRNQTNQQQQPMKNLSVVQGTLTERKIKVRNIDARVVSVADLQKLFSKCGPLINASFDTNEFGAYLGTATVIYSKASSAVRAIKDYHMAQIDQRPMKVQYATPLGGNQQKNSLNVQQQQPQQAQRANSAPAIRKTNNRIGKTGAGKTLNVMGNNNQQRRRNQRGGRGGNQM